MSSARLGGPRPAPAPCPRSATRCSAVPAAPPPRTPRSARWTRLRTMASLSKGATLPRSFSSLYPSAGSTPTGGDQRQRTLPRSYTTGCVCTLCCSAGCQEYRGPTGRGRWWWRLASLLEWLCALPFLRRLVIARLRGKPLLNAVGCRRFSPCCARVFSLVGISAWPDDCVWCGCCRTVGTCSGFGPLWSFPHEGPFSDRRTPNPSHPYPTPTPSRLVLMEVYSYTTSMLVLALGYHMKGHLALFSPRSGHAGPCPLGACRA